MAAKTTDETNHHRHHHHHHRNINNNSNNSINDLLSGWGTGRPCNICQNAASLIYCNTDSAFFCGPCDAKIHPPTRFPRHERVWVCEVCEQLPSVFACKADDANLCSACDHDIHSVNPLARRHDRVPVIPFYDSPIDAAAARSASASAFLVPENLDSASAISAESGGADDDANTWLIPNPNPSFLYNDSDILNYNNNNYGCPKFVTNSPQFQRQDDAKPSVILEDDNHRNYASADSVVPSQSQGNTYNNNNNSNNFAVNSSHNFVNSNSLFDNCFNIDFTQPNKLQKKNNNDSHHLSPSFNYSASSSEIGVVPDGSASSMSEISYSFAKSTAGDSGSFGGAPVMDREARVLRYREKRKNRKFEKTIRYASRKAYAETRPRVKGRFAKRTDSSETSEVDFAGDNGGYGVVPAF